MRHTIPSVLLGLTVLSAPAFALAPSDIWIVANKNIADSKAIAEYYCDQRGVPKGQIIYLDLSANEDISRGGYSDHVLKPLRTALTPHKAKVKLLLTVYGVPLRVGATTPTPAEAAEGASLQKDIDALVKERNEVYAEITAKSPAAATDPAVAKEVAALKARYAQLVSQIDSKQARRRHVMHLESVAALDSELANMWADSTEFRLYAQSPMYWRLPASQAKYYPPIVMTCRLDGPTAAITRGLIDQAVATEAKGLSGKAYFDARGLKYDAKTDPLGTGSNGYDQSIREAAAMFGPKTETVLDNKPALFPADSCPDYAIYCGWYSHAKYVASNKFVPGSIGYHIASSEMASLKRPGVTFWCKRMLEDGVAVTIGPVAEPYTLGFPKPAEFYGFLGTGATVAESYWLSNRWVSWTMVLVGDPLYKPFGKAPLWGLDAVKVSPAGSNR